MDDVLGRLSAALADRYSIERELGQGGMATVYLAGDLKHHRKVALKVLRPELATTLGPERFLREIELAARLTHPHILPLHDSGTAEGFLYYVMPYVDGESLRDRLTRERQLRLEDALNVAREVADALSYAHAHGVIHRDIKPENILLESGHAVVADFGIARAVDEAGGERVTQTGVAIGTPAYMSPEQAAGSRDLDGRSDLYSLGCVLYEMLAGRPPFMGPTADSVVRQQLAAEPPPIVSIRPGVPRGVSLALERALAKAPADRFASAHQFDETLRTASESAPSTGHRRRARRAARLAAVVLASAALLALAWWGIAKLGAPAPVIRSLAVLPLENLTGDSGQAYFVGGMQEALIAELGKISALKVISRISTMRYRRTTASAPQIARELGVDGLIEGSVEREGDSVRISVQLIHGPTDRQLWTNAYQRELRGVLALYSDVARGIAREMRVAIAPSDSSRLARARPVNPAAYDAYLRGRFRILEYTPQALDAALAHFQLATDMDSTYAPAWTGIALVWGLRGHFYVPGREAWPRQKAAALRAVQLDDGLAEAHEALATYRFYSEWDWARGEREFQRSIELSPRCTDWHSMYVYSLLVRSRLEEAMSELQRCLQSDPLNPALQADVGFTLVLMRRYHDAISQEQRVLTSAPGYLLAVMELAQALEGAGMYEEALAAAKRAFALRGDSAVVTAMERGSAVAGYREAMRRAAETLAARSARSYVEPVAIAEFYVKAGENDRALDWLERAHREHASMLVYLRVHPEWDPLRRDPRFQGLLRRMNFPT